MSLFSKPSDRQVDLGLLVLRTIVGIVFVAHGAQKVFVFGFDGVAAGFAGMGVPMAGIVGPFIGLLELFGGLALIAGLLTRLASLGLASTMLVATLLVHLKNGFFAPNGVEFTLTLLAATLMLTLTGAGRFAVDSLIGRRKATQPAADGVRLRRAA